PPEARAFRQHRSAAPSGKRSAGRIEMKTRRVGSLVVARRSLLRRGDRLFAAADLRAERRSFQNPRFVAEPRVSIDAAGERGAAQVSAQWSAAAVGGDVPRCSGGL